MTPHQNYDREGVVYPADIDELCEILGRCGAERKTVELGGLFTKRAMGGKVTPADVVASTARIDRVAEYEPKDLTIGVEPGLSYQALEDLLAANRQMLPLDPPLASEATIGGAVAANCCGPRRRLYGSARDLVIGMSFVTLEGKQVRSGGMVVKNVAGLDMAKLLIGSFGTLAAIARINFRLYPRPVEEKTFLLAFDSLEAALSARDAVLRSVLQPQAVDLANPAAATRLGGGLPARYLFLVEAGGIEAVLARYERELKNIARDAGAAEFLEFEEERGRRLWSAVRDFPALRTERDSDAAVLRISTTLSRLGECFALAGSLPALARAGSGIAYVRCPSPFAELVQRARAAGLSTVVESCAAAGKDSVELWADPGPELEVMSRIKQALDPHHLLNHGRLYNRL
ncbi:MAG: FAD-binding oxidoreductase [Acidobacteria bacterium]|nr:FAD-binding oxidoreductase [Acidobacteriota bacterium]